MPAQALEVLLRAVPLDILRIHPLNLHPAIVGDAAVADRLIDGLVGVLQLDVLAHDTNADAVLRGDELADDLLPMRHVGRRRIQAQ